MYLSLSLSLSMSLLVTTTSCLLISDQMSQRSRYLGLLLGGVLKMHLSLSLSLSLSLYLSLSIFFSQVMSLDHSDQMDETDIGRYRAVSATDWTVKEPVACKKVYLGSPGKRRMKA